VVATLLDDFIFDCVSLCFLFEKLLFRLGDFDGVLKLLR
jgi:hypothetical protein